MNQPVRPAEVKSRWTATSSDHLARTGQLSDPAHMTPSARVVELGATLAAAARRLRLSLDGSRRVERDCPAMETTRTEARA